MAAKKYIELDGLAAFWAKAKTYIETELAKKADTGDIPDVSAFITKSVNDLANYYTKSNTYTKTEVNNLVNAVKQFTYESVATLPTASASTMNKIYLVPATNTADKNIKDEFITINTGTAQSPQYKWEQIGSTTLDLSGYVTSTALTTILADYALTSEVTETLKGYVTTSALNTKLGDYVTSSALTTKLNDYYTKSNTYSKTEVDNAVGARVLQSAYNSDMTIVNGNFTTINSKLNDIGTATTAECEGVVTGS